MEPKSPVLNQPFLKEERVAFLLFAYCLITVSPLMTISPTLFFSNILPYLSIISTNGPVPIPTVPFFLTLGGSGLDAIW